MSEEFREEYTKCLESPAYFYNNYCFINRVANTRAFKHGIQRRLFTKLVFLTNYNHIKL